MVKRRPTQVSSVNTVLLSVLSQKVDVMMQMFFFNLGQTCWSLIRGGGVLHQPEGVHFARMTDSFNIIPLTTWLFTKQINNVTPNNGVKIFD